MTSISSFTSGFDLTKRINDIDKSYLEQNAKGQSVFHSAQGTGGEEYSLTQKAIGKEKADSSILGDFGKWSTLGQTSKSSNGKATNTFKGSIGQEAVLGQTAKGKKKSTNIADVEAGTPMSKIYQEAFGPNPENKLNAKISSGDVRQTASGGTNTAKITGDNNRYEGRAGKGGTNNLDLKGNENDVILKGKNSNINVEGDKNNIEAKGAVKGTVKGKKTNVNTGKGDNDLVASGKGTYVDTGKDDNDSITLKGRNAKRSKVEGYETIKGGGGNDLVWNDKEGKKGRYVNKEKYEKKQAKAAEQEKEKTQEQKPESKPAQKPEKK